MRMNLLAAGFTAALAAFSGTAMAGLIGDTIARHYIFSNPVAA